MAGEDYNGYGGNREADDVDNWEKWQGLDRTDELDRVTAEEEKEIKDLYPGEYDDDGDDENVTPEAEGEVAADDATGETKEDA